MPTLDKLHPEALDQSTLARSGHSRDADPIGFSGLRKKPDEEFLSLFPMIRTVAFDQGDRSSKDGSIRSTYSVRIVVERQLPPFSQRTHDLVA